MIVKFNTLPDGPTSGTILHGVEVQLVPQPSVTTATTLSDKELINVIRHEYRDQRVTPALAELLRRKGL